MRVVADMPSMRVADFSHALVGAVVLGCVFVGIVAIGPTTDALAGVDPATGSFMEVACPSVSQCTAVDGGGEEVTFDPTAPGTPTPAMIDPSGALELVALESVACPSVTQCTAVDNIGRAVTFNPTAPGAPSAVTIDPSVRLVAVACPSVAQCTAVDGAGRAVTFNPTTPGSASLRTIDSSGDLWAAVACPSVLQCTAVENGGQQVTFNPSASGAPTPNTIDPSGELVSVACPSISQCTAVEVNGREVTFDPNTTGITGVALIDEPRFCGEHCPEARLTSVACPSVVQCTAVDTHDVAVTFDPISPGSPKPTGLVGGPGLSVVFYGFGDAVACPSVSQCTAIEKWEWGTTSESREEEWEVTFDPSASGIQTSAVIEAHVVGLTTTTTITTTTPTARTPLRGIAKAAGSGSVKQGVAAIKLVCTGSGACRGTVELIARVNEKRTVEHRGKRRMVNHTSKVVIGKTSFSIAKGKSAILRVHLSPEGGALLRMAGKHGLKVNVEGNDTEPGAVVLTEARTVVKQKPESKR